MRSRAVVRGVPWADLDPVPSAVADPETMTRIWGPMRTEEVAYRGLSLQSWNVASKGYVLFAACRPDEIAFEYPFQKGEPQGALTYWLLDTLSRYGLRQSCGEIHQRLLARIRGLFVRQTPVVLGDGERLFLGPERGVMREAVRALRASGDGQVLIDVGSALGIRPGDRYVLPDGVYEARQVGATETWVERIKAYKNRGPVEPGTRAEVLPLRSTVYLVPPEPGDASAERALARVQEALRDSSFVEVDGDGTIADLRVAVDGQGSYEVQSPAGLTFPNLRPLPVKSPGAARELVRRLDHLTRFRNILAVENPAPPDWLRIGLEVMGDESAKPVTARLVDLRVGEGVILRIVNRSTLRLDFTVLDLQPDYGVSQLLPVRGSLSLLALDPGEGKIVRVKAWLPPGIDEGTDVLKVFATRGALSFRRLELAPLCKPAQGPVFRGTPKNPLEQLFAQLAGTVPVRGGLTPSEFPEEEWLTAQMEVRVRR